LLLSRPEIGAKLANFRGFVHFMRAELDRIGPAQAALCRDFFGRAVALELSFFEAAYTDRI
jgi:thiaminase/transcriptional activator TenA